ncbi:ankyrin repeat domain-containing protein [Brachyspira sp.]|uniref:ankyrin repeat domain-containing protein n=1 Tax=Brachyspira sp. TaxID=1977261 RepID=UPI003D7E8134
MNRKITNKIILIISIFLILSSLLFAGNFPTAEALSEFFKELMVLSLIYVIIPIVFIIIAVIVILSRKLRTTIKLIIVVIIIVSYLFIYRTYTLNRDAGDLLVEAAKVGDLRNVKKFMKIKRVSDGDIHAALSWAASKGDFETVEYLIGRYYGSYRSDFGGTALIYASGGESVRNG